jgi:hypothetical protein
MGKRFWQSLQSIVVVEAAVAVDDEDCQDRAVPSQDPYPWHSMHSSTGYLGAAMMAE